MRKVLFAAVALSPLFGGAAFAACPIPVGAGPGGQPSKCAVGPMDYPDAQAQWARLRAGNAAQASGVQPAHGALPGQSSAASPNG